MKRFKVFKDKYAGKKALIIGCGNSANQIKGKDLSDLLTIGVNDVGLIYWPNFLLVVDYPNKFEGKRLKLVREAESDYVATQIRDWKIKDSNKKVMFELGGKNLKFLDKDKYPNTLDYSNNSPYVGVIMAYKMGCTKIGMIGVDFTPNHFYKDDGDHILIEKKKEKVIKRDYKILYKELSKKKIKIYNLSKDSIIDTIPKLTIDDFLNKI